MPEGRALEDEAAACVELLERLVADRALLAGLPAAVRRRLLEVAGRVSRPERDEQRRMAKAFRKKEKDERREADTRLLEATGIRALRREAVFPTLLAGSQVDPPPGLGRSTAGGHETEPGAERVLREPSKCYLCKSEFTRVHAFYDQLCPDCAALSWDRRHQSADLRGRVAVVTGARVKIGYQAAIKLLRSGATVVATTRFPRDAASRYAREPDFAEWRERLSVYGLDLRHTPSVESFARHVASTSARLDFLVHNACQTVRRPVGYYAHLLEGERVPAASLPDPERAVLAPFEPRRIADPVALSQVALLRDDLERGEHLFPAGQLDQDLQQIDLRGANSWRMRLHEVPTVELLEVHLVNAVAPFVLSARLREVMLRVSSRDKHIVNVSAMEGQFYREFKTDKHPHTNMAKAALNMLTRTSAADYARDGIHMNSVDTGWVTDEDPATLAARKVEEHGFHPPLDVVEGAARILDPIYSGLRTGQHAWGKFFKDYRETPW